MTDNDELSGMRDLHATIDATIELLAAFLNAAATADLPSEALVAAAHQAAGDLAEWRETLAEILQREDGSEASH